MRLLRLDDLMTSYTNAHPGVGLLLVDLDLGTASGRLASRCRTSPMQRAWYTSSMALDTRAGCGHFVYEGIRACLNALRCRTPPVSLPRLLWSAV